MIVIEDCAVATVDAAGTEYADGHVVVDGDRIVAVGPGPRRAATAGRRRVDGTGCLVTPGLVNTHHHLYQWATRGLAQQETLFGWLTELYPIWARHGRRRSWHAAAAAGLGWLALSGCTTSDRPPLRVPPRRRRHAGRRDRGGRGGSACGSTRAAGSMDLAESDGGLPPDSVVEDTDAALAATEDAIDRFHDPSPGAMVRIAVAPCSPVLGHRAS